jgi:hypothetical protein
MIELDMVYVSYFRDFLSKQNILFRLSPPRKAATSCTDVKLSNRKHAYTLVRVSYSHTIKHASTRVKDRTQATAKHVTSTTHLIASNWPRIRLSIVYVCTKMKMEVTKRE